VETTWTVSHEQPRARSLLFTLSFLDHSVIWEEVLQFVYRGFAAIAADESQEGLPKYLVKLFTDDGYSLDVAVKPLLAFSMICRKEGYYDYRNFLGHGKTEPRMSPVTSLIFHLYLADNP
jgi:hypothetical protein